MNMILIHHAIAVIVRGNKFCHIPHQISRDKGHIPGTDKYIIAGCVDQDLPDSFHRSDLAMLITDNGKPHILIFSGHSSRNTGLLIEPLQLLTDSVQESAVLIFH